MAGRVLAHGDPAPLARVVLQAGLGSCVSERLALRQESPASNMRREPVFDPLSEPTVEELSQRRARPDPDWELAARHVPVLLFDRQEPFLPLAAGYTIFRRNARSHSAHRSIQLDRKGLPRADTIIEYAIWWDFDIGHLYELEHIWLHLDAHGEPVYAEGSRHGRYHSMLIHGELPVADGRLTLFSEAGKHGFAPARSWLERLAPVTRKLCTSHAGLEGVLITWLFRGIIRAKTPEADRLVHTYLERQAFEPTLEFGRRYALPPEALVPWPALFEWIPQRVAWWVSRLRQTIPHSQQRFFRIAQGAASENTRAAIVMAATLGADIVKLHVQPGAGGRARVIHRLQEASGGPAPREPQPPAPGRGRAALTLEEAIACCRQHHLGLYLELEDEAIIQPVVELLRRRRLYERAGICSSQPAWLVRVKALDHRILTALLVNSPTLNAIALAQAVGANYIHLTWDDRSPGLDPGLTAEWIERVRAAGLGLICGPEGHLSDLAQLRRLGVDGIASGRPGRLRPRPG